MILFGAAVGTTSVGNQTALYLEAPAEIVSTSSGLLGTFGPIGSVAAATATRIAFPSQVSEHGLRDMTLMLIGVAVVVLAMTVLDRALGRGR